VIMPFHCSGVTSALSLVQNSSCAASTRTSPTTSSGTVLANSLTTRPPKALLPAACRRLVFLEPAAGRGV